MNTMLSLVLVKGVTGPTGYGGGGISGTGPTGYTGLTGAMGPTGTFSSMFTKSVCPDTTISYDLGSPAYAFRTLYVSCVTGPNGGAVLGLNNNTNSMGTGWTGSTGATGWTGTTGETGFTGATGYTGFTGSTGFTGATGIQGVDGTQGPIGNTGYTGIQGVDGTQGPIGNTGYTGIQGVAGTQGPIGNTGYTGAAGAAQVFDNYALLSGADFNGPVRSRGDFTLDTSFINNALYYETTLRVGGVANAYTASYGDGGIFYIPTSLNMTANSTLFITNIPTTTTQSFTITVGYYQLSTRFYINNIRVEDTEASYILGTMSTFVPPLFNGGTPALTGGTPCLIFQQFTVFSVEALRYVGTSISCFQ